MKNISIYCLLFLLGMIQASCEDELFVQPENEVSGVPVKIIATYASPGVQTRLNYVDNASADEPVQVTWSANDKIKVFVQMTPKDGDGSSDVKWDAEYMAISNGAGTGTAEFAGYFREVPGYEFKDGAVVYAFYPITAGMSLHQKGIEIDLNRMVTKYGDMNELMYYDYMVAKGVYKKNTDNDDGTVELKFEHQVCMLRLELGIPQTTQEMSIGEIKISGNDLLTRGYKKFTEEAGWQTPVKDEENDRNHQYVEFTSSNRPKTSTTGATNITAYVMVIPTKLNNPLTISAQVGGDVYSKTIDFTSKPTLEAGKRYAIKADLEGVVISDYSWYTNPEPDGSYLLKDEGDLRAFSNITNGLSLPADIDQDNFKGKVVKLDSDISLSADWTPIGSSNQFAGIFDGQGHTVSNLQIDKENLTAQGFFSTLSGGGIVQNLNIGSGNVVCYDSGGGVVGLLMQGSIINCTNRADVSIISQALVFDEQSRKMYRPCVGGIIGYSLQGMAIGCVNYGTVKSVSYGVSGGIVGYNYPFNLNDATIGATDPGGYVLACANHGEIISDAYASGIIGYSESGGHGAVGCFNSYTGMIDSKAGACYAIAFELGANKGCFVIADEVDNEFNDKANVVPVSQVNLNESEFSVMNEAIVEHNKKFAMNSMFYCHYQWKGGAEWPVVFKMGGLGGSTGDYGDGGQLGN